MEEKRKGFVAGTAWGGQHGQGLPGGEDEARTAETLLDAMLCLRSREEAAALLTDLCTIQELQDLRKRLQVAGMLKEGLNYQEIGRLTAMSTATISRVNRALRYGAGGYHLVLSRLEEKKAEQLSKPGQPD